VAIVAVLLWAAAAWLLLPTLADLSNVVRCLARRRRAAGDPAPRLPRLLFLVPAHNEEKTVGACLTSLQRMDYPPTRMAVVVVADNCDDATASIARHAGAQCLVRTDLERRGKPHALAWALARLPVADFDAVTIVDADTEVASDFARALAQSGAARDVAVQPYNGVLNRTANALTRMAAVLSSASHQYAFRLKSCAGCNVPLSAGMCLGSDILQTYGWPALSIGEDWEWYARLTAEGITVRSAWRARLSAQEAVSLRQSGPQRRRWMLGKAYVLVTVGPRIVMSRHASTAQKLDAIAELAQLGPVLQLALVGFGVAAALLAGIANPAPLIIAFLTSLLRPGVYACLATVADPQPGRAVLAFSYLPVYAAWRVANAMWGLLTLRDRRWVRTQRTP
jgi:1,2-diacylglycerol 3-beta-glucosyltransferase